MNQVDLTALTDATLRCHVTMHTTKLEEALQVITDAEVALGKIDDEFTRRNSMMAVGAVVNKFAAQ